MKYKFSEFIKKEESKFLNKEVNGTDLIRISDANHYYEKFIKLNLPVVSRSIGNDTKPILMTVTKEQEEKGLTPCKLCKYRRNKMNSAECRKCMTKNDYNQYYG